ncbi:hypothetical protein [Neorhodopirellula lusitana]|uniref:hypothetical protein n=1 Tax=Neorhodopirellula lusitana TaxID=445327 RepID=UPI00384BC580
MSRYAAAGLLVLLAASYRLWLPPHWTATHLYPNVPMLDLPAAWLGICNLLTMAILVIAGPVLLAFDRPERSLLRRASWCTIAITFAVAFTADQHRLQPWAYQLALYAVLFALVPRQRVVGYLQLLTISIYAYSSIGKFDYQFLHTVGQEFLAAAAGLVGIQVETWDESIRTKLAAGFPAIELLAAILLVIPKTRRIGGWLAIAMHASLLVLLSPWVMSHSAGVLTWNVFLAGQAYLLFCRPTSTDGANVKSGEGERPDEATPLPTNPWQAMLANAIVAVAILLPLTERRGRHDATQFHWDHWLSWALYSPHNSRVHAEIHRNVLGKMPAELQGMVSDDTDGDGWQTLDLDKWSLQTRGVPILPQARYQLLVAGKLARANDWNREIRCVLRSASDRFDGTRSETWLRDYQAMHEAENRFWLSGNASSESGEGR